MPDLQRAGDGAHVVRAYGQAVFEGHGIAEVHDGAYLREALALCDTGEQGLDGAHKLVRVYAERAESLAVGHYFGGLLDLHALERPFAGGYALVQQRGDLGYRPRVVRALHGDDAEAGVRQKLKN